MVGHAKDLLTTQGFRGLYQGFWATTLRDAPYAGLYLLIYESLKEATFWGPLLQSHFKETVNGEVVRNGTCALAAASVASLVTHPFDVIKTRIQLYPLQYH